MNLSHPFTLVSVGLACLGLLLPISVLEAAQVGSLAADHQPMRPGQPPISDVELDTQGSLHGVVVNAHEVPIASVPIVVFRGDREVTRTLTDAHGRFSVAGLQGGSLRLAVGRGTSLLRAWAARTAPPGASHGVRIVLADDVVRGQTPLRDFLCSDCVIVAALVAAMIAVPIAIHNSNRGPSSP